MSMNKVNFTDPQKLNPGQIWREDEYNNYPGTII